ncbi:UBX domain-containing protein 10 [Lepus europaeus]|uniref:UBX domain-containing protein 10 n=1 Tax=Lepus europaeus TaxID=9983 RepID=UPI002B49512A|nr:UBX domain-containing protein 10 [Lepus europaeus]
MAREGPVNIPAAERSTIVSPAANGFLWQPDSLQMHVARPKSAKGRTRPSLPRAQGTEASSPRTPASPPPAMPCESLSSQKPGTCAPRSPNQGAPVGLPERRQQLPAGTSCSLNRYPVLPSIMRKNLAAGAVDRVAEKASSLQLDSVPAPYPEDSYAMKTREDSRALERNFGAQPKTQAFCRAGDLEEPSDQEPRLLLAIRSPSGQRFIHHFRPTDDLQTVVAVAERKNQATYRPCSIETVEVPRRRFPDLTKSLQECRIPHKSVLSISREEEEGWP